MSRPKSMLFLAARHFESMKFTNTPATKNNKQVHLETVATKQGRPCDKYRSSVVEGMSSTNLVNDKCSWSGTCGKEDHPQKTHFGFLWQSYKSFFVFAYLLCYALPNSYALLQIVFPSYTIVMTCQIGMPCLIVMPCQIVMICQIVISTAKFLSYSDEIGLIIISRKLQIRHNLETETPSTSTTTIIDYLPLSAGRCHSHP